MHHCKSARFKSIQATARARRRLRWGSRCARRAMDLTCSCFSLPRSCTVPNMTQHLDWGYASYKPTATRPKPVPTACSCASISARSNRFVGTRRSIVSRTFSLYLYPYRTDYSGVLLLSLLLGLCPCEKEENVGEVIPPADQGQSTVVCTKSRARIGRGQRPAALALRVGHRAALPARRGRGVDARAGRGRRST